MNNRLFEINTSIHDTIHRQDEKATSLFTATGIIFGLSSFLVTELTSKNNKLVVTLIWVFGCLYLLTFIALVFLFAFTIFPRRKTRKDKQTGLYFNNYPEDILLKVKSNELVKFLREDPSDDVIVDQIRIGTYIYHKKENLIIASVVATIIFSFLLVALIILSAI